jgi:gliding motility-associated-like protein
MSCLKKIKNKRAGLILSALLLVFIPRLAAQNGTWVWMHGSNVSNSSGNFGTQGVAAATNDPPAMYETTELVDLNGNFWIFGGLDNNFGEQTALWKFDPVTNMWTWMKGPNTGGQPGVYGTQGVPSAANYPGSRAWGVMSWTDAVGNLWIFGGYGYDAFGGVGALADLWKYDISTNMWTWMKGPNTVNYTGSFGTLQVPSATNAPGGRYEAATAWTANNGEMYMYGGGGPNGFWNDVWKYSPATNMWTWMSGPNTYNNPPSYGTQFIPSVTNTPGGRYVYGRWKDLSGNLWLFGGSGTNGTYADMWMYDINTNVWVWIAGSNVANDPGTFTTQCVPTNDYPAARYENRCAWTDDCGRFWQFGGFGGGIGTLDDLWMFDPNTTQFTWVGGSTNSGGPGNYGTMLVPAPTNYPESGAGGAAFRDLQGNFWMFGAWTAGGKANALWKYTMDPNCPAPTQMQVAINYTPPACAPQTINFNASTNNVNWSYYWDFGDPSTTTDTALTAASSYNYLTPGTYTVTLIVSGNTGCAIGTDTATAVIVIGGANALSIGNDTAICGPVNLTLNAGSATSYNWSTGATSQTINVSSTGTYWVTINSATCPATDSINVTSATGPYIGPDSTFCAGGSITYNAGVANSYVWNTGDTTQTISPTTSGQYYVTVTIVNCTFSDTANLTVVPSPLVNIGNDTSICGAFNVALNAGNPGATYAWSTGANTQTINVSAQGTYWVTASNGNCSDVDTINITATTPPSLGTDTSFCQGQQVILDGGTGTGYTWSTGATTQTITVSSSGIYWVDVANGNCIERDSITVTVNPLPVVNLGPDTTLCPGNTITFDATNAGATYAWNNGAQTASINVDSAGTYSVTVSVNNCVSTDNVVVGLAQPIYLGSMISLCGEFEITLDAGNPGATYLWNTGATSQTIVISEPGQYVVEVNSNNCIQTDTVDVIGTPGEGVVYVPNTFTPNGNVTNEKFTAVGDGITSYHMHIFNRWGELIFETTDMNAGWDGTYHGKLVQQDTYVYQIEYVTLCSDKKKRVVGHVNVIR